MASNGTNATWVPPSWETLNFTANCSLFTLFFLETNITGREPRPLVAIANYFRSIIPSTTKPPAGGVSDAQLIAWYDLLVRKGPNTTATAPWNGDIVGHGTISQLATREVEKKGACVGEICAAFDGKLNSALPGPGMLGAFVIMALLITLCASVELMLRRRERTLGEGRRPTERDVVFRDSVAVWTMNIYMAAIIFAIAVHLDLHTRVRSNRNETRSAFESELSAFTATLSILPVFLLFHLTLTSKGLRRSRKWFIRFFYASLYIMWETALQWYSALNISFVGFRFPLTLTPRYWRCPEKAFAGHLGVITICMTVVMVLPLLRVLLYILDIFFSGRLATMPRRVWDKFPPHFLNWTLGAACFFGMWTILGLLLVIKWGTFVTGPLGSQWTVGQFLAIGIWVPSCLQLLGFLLGDTPLADMPVDGENHELELMRQETQVLLPPAVVPDLEAQDNTVTTEGQRQETEVVVQIEGPSKPRDPI